jgi:peptidoglycan/xylan/chitin deacetylase (PgdA/CDA1 family)
VAGSGGSGGSSAGAAGAAGSAGGFASDAGADSGFPAPDKLVALTFDDGPDATLTNAVLDKLDAHGVPASFFLIGTQIGDDDAAVLARAAALGCTFENHSNGFDPLDMLATEAEVDANVDAATTAIQAATGTVPEFFRAPNLLTSPTMFAAIDLPFASGIVVGDFPGGNAGGNPTVDSVVNVVRAQIRDGSIILMHDVQPALNPQVTPDALDIIIPELESQGYEFVNLRQLFERRGVDPSSLVDNQWTVVPPP